jgi:hypothetical protein
MFRRSLPVLLACSVLATACGDGDDDRSTAPVVTAGGGEDAPPGAGDGVHDVAVGDCFDLAEDDTGTGGDAQVEQVGLVPCDEPHGYEVFHAFEFEDGPHPGDPAVKTASDQGCLEPFDTFVDEGATDADLAIYVLHPTAESWEQGDRSVTCAVFDRSGGQLAGSVRSGPG